MVFKSLSTQAKLKKENLQEAMEALHQRKVAGHSQLVDQIFLQNLEPSN